MEVPSDVTRAKGEVLSPVSSSGIHPASASGLRARSAAGVERAGVPPGAQQGGLRQAWASGAQPATLTRLGISTKVSEANPSSHITSHFLLPEIEHPVKITYAQYEKYLKADNMIRTTSRVPGH